MAIENMADITDTFQRGSLPVLLGDCLHVFLQLSVPIIGGVSVAYRTSLGLIHQIILAICIYHGAGFQRIILSTVERRVGNFETVGDYNLVGQVSLSV